ncbi:hypothetical protein OSB04_015514 [Centaurea solstitialis]|uniref:DOG1 domain-containing protein n=1 Tax=Centaurea solstitialis TaxID=347529 RepID=A0AA38T0U1_9ASTR|nr:hypothetical protein OSB04_015514 [Centaurea solstitialis]
MCVCVRKSRVITVNMAKPMKHQQFQSCYHNWVAQQRLDLDELLQALTRYSTDSDYLKLITDKTISHFESYNDARAQLAKHDGPSFLAPTWGSTCENSLLWIGGCRPSLIIRLVYELCGSQMNARFAEFLEGIGRGNLAEISSSQLKRIDELQVKTIKNEDKLRSRVASLQAYTINSINAIFCYDKISIEMKADELLLVLLANLGREAEEKGRDEVVGKAMDSHALDSYNVLIEADQLRLNTLKGMIDILTPLQAVEFLVASKKLHLSLHEWSKTRDLRMGITHLLNTNNAPLSSSDPPPPEP